MRQKWILLLAAVIGAGAGYYAYHSVEPIYQTQGEMFINSQNPMGNLGGPIAQGQLLGSSSWDDLIRSFMVLDSVVIQDRLYVIPGEGASEALEDFAVMENHALGRFRLQVSEDGSQWRLLWRNPVDEWQEMSAGRPGDVIAPPDSLGFLWTPPPAELTPGRKIDFQVIHPRDAAQRLRGRIGIDIHGEGSFITLSLSGEDPEQIAQTLSAVMLRHQKVASNLKRMKLDELTGILQDQLATIRADLEEAEGAYQSFQVQTITQPTEETGRIAPGLEQTRGPVYGEYFGQRIVLDDLQQDIGRLEDILSTLEGDGAVAVEAFDLIPSVGTSPELQGALNELVQARAETRALQRDYTDEHQLVRDELNRVRTLENVTIPMLTRSLLGQLRNHAGGLQDLIDERAGELQQIPPRTIQERRLERRMQIADRIYTDLENKYQAAELAAAASTPDVEILSEPTVPQVPSQDERARTAGMAFLGILGAGILGVILMDRFDQRIRDPLQVQNDIGLEILGAIPRIRLSGKVNTGEVTEAFREIRMRLEFAYGSTKPLIVAVTSPDTGEGKTLVSANLAIAFSQLKHRTLLIDADTRRGDVHELLDVDRKPGLTDLLRGHANGDALKSTSHPHLSFLGSGSRISSSPELLSGGRMQDLMAQVKQRYDVVIIDCPPMAAGGDAFVVGAHAGSVLVVMRSGSTHLALAKAKMEAFYRLPVRILGAVLNDVEESAAYGNYRYYSYYLPGYRAETEDEREEPVATAGDVAT